MRRALATLLLAATAVLPARAAEEELPPFVRLTYRVVVERRDTTGSTERAPLVPRDESALVVTLGQGVAAYGEADGPFDVLDEAAGVRRRVDRAAGTYTQVALLEGVAFAELELRNRIGMRSLLDKVEKSDPSLAPLELAILFGLRSEDGTPLPERTERDGATVFSVGDDELAEAELSDVLLDVGQRAALERVLFRRAHLHPEVRGVLVDSGRAPKRLRFRWTNIGEADTAEWTLTAAERTAENPADTSALRRVFADDALGKLEPALLGDDAGATLPPRLSASELAADAGTALREGRAREALLIAFECALQHGDPPPGVMEALVGDKALQAEVAPMLGAIGLVNRDPRRALEAMDALDRSDLTRTYVLDVFHANALDRSGQPAGAERELLGVLGKAPHLTGAYKDLGDIYLRAFRTAEAWRAYEAGRAVNRRHGIWEPLAKFEEHLRKAFKDVL